ncbi:hypothetical protein SDC9_158388 [bioreactor metagenome]|uniref:Uncharacterized protein n=1 Tax=bioreactor metagenome TaxID=1076179 RepID=A0A645FA14_9ZZZZ
MDQTHDVLLHLTSQHPLHHFHGFGIGHAHALDEFTLLAQALKRGLDLRAAAMHHHRVHAHQFKQHHIFGKVGLQLGIGHGVAAVLDHHGLAMELADVGKRLSQDFGLVARCNRGKIVHGWRASRKR